MCLEAVAERLEPRDDVVERLRALPPEPEARVDDDDLGAGSGRDPGRAVERAEGLLRLPLVWVTRECEQRRVHGQGDVVLLGHLAQPLGPRVVHPETALEVELAGGVATLEQELDRLLRRLAGRAACRADADRSHCCKTLVNAACDAVRWGS